MRNDVPITVHGNLTGDPELKYASTGTAMARFTVAFNPRKRDGDKWVDGDPSFYSCTAFGQLAENAAESLKKGDRVIVVGALQQRQWETDTGEKKSTWQVLVDEVGPSLAWATAKVSKAARVSRGEVPPDDPWATASSSPPAGGGFDAEPPY